MKITVKSKEYSNDLLVAYISPPESNQKLINTVQSLKAQQVPGNERNWKITFEQETFFLRIKKF